MIRQRRRLLNWFRSNKKKHRRREDRGAFLRPPMERLEDRNLLAADTEVGLTGGVLSITDINGGNSADDLTLSHLAGAYTLTDNGGLTISTAITGATGSGTSTVTFPDTGVTSIVFDTLGGDDVLTVNSVQASLPGGFTVNDGAGSDRFTLGGDIDAAAGDVSITVSRNILLAAGSSISTSSGDITLEANLANASSGDFTGIEINDAELTTASGAITLSGQGGDTGSGGRRNGVYVLNGATVSSTGSGAVGPITISGTGAGGAGVISGAFGVDIASDFPSLTAPAMVTSVDADIVITGSGANAPAGGAGATPGVVVRDGGTLESTGSGSITLDGTGGTTASGGSVGVSLANVNLFTSTTSRVRTNTGGISITGTHVAGGFGINLNNKNEVISTGGGPITLTADDLRIVGDSTLASSGDLTVRPETPGTTIGLGGGIGTLELDSAELAYFDGFNLITIGDAANTSTVDVQSWTHTDPVQIIGQTIDVNGPLSGGVNDLTLTASRNIALNSGSSISTSSGDITLEANLANASSGDFTGIEINDAELTTASGAITLSGQGGDTGSGGRRNGVYVLNGATVSSTGSGAVGPITISGTGAGGAGVISGAFGVDIASDFPSLTAPAMVTSVDADIVITGSGANAPAGGAGATPGVVVRDGGTLESTGSGSITLDGTGGTTASGGSVGVSLANVNLFTSTTSRVRTNTGGISITGTHVAGGFGINLNNKNEVISTGGGPITLTADDLRIVGDSTLASSGDLTVRPETPGTTIGLGGGSGTLELDDSELAYFSGFGAITIGDAAAGDITIDTATFADPLNLLTGGAVFDGPGADLTMTNGDVVTINGVVSPGLSPGQLVVDGDFAFGGGSTFDLELEGTTPGSQHDQIRVEGAARNVDLNNATLSTSLGAGYTPAFGEELVIVDLVDAGSTLSGAFSGLAEGDLVNIGGADFSISYAGGADNNDVVLTVFADTEVSLSGGVLSITDIFGGSSNDNLTISHSAGSYTISDSGGLLIGSEIPGASGSLTSTLVVPDTGVTSIVFDTLGGDDVLTVNSVQASLPGGFTVNDGAGSDRFTLGGDIDAAAGDVSITVSRNILLAAGSSISTSSGDITLEANLANASSGDFTGIEINDAELTTASGAITLSGQGGDTGSGGRRNGVYVLNGATVSSTGSGAVGPITISGTGAGGAGVISGAFGVDIASDFPSLTAPAMVTSVDADIVITGSGANAPAGGAGATPGVVVRDGGTLESTGSGSITLDGTGGTTASGGSVGVSLANVNLFTSTTSRVRTNTGGISITGTHVAGGFGINLNNKNEVISTGGGPITLTADDLRIVGDSTLASSGDLTVRPETPGTTIGLGGGIGTLELDSAELAYFDGFNLITIGDAANTSTVDVQSWTHTDPVQIIGQTIDVNGPLSGGVNDLTLTASRNIALNSGSSISTSSGDITLEANLANASSGDFTGIEINDAELTTASGAITLSGQGGDTGSGGRRNGVYVLNGATVSSTGSGAVGPITISGTGAGGAGVISGAFGVDIASDFPSLTAPAMVTSVDADIVITGSGANAPAGGAGATPGVVVRDGGTLESTGSGSITLDGTGGTTASGGSVGVSLANVNLFTSTTSRVRTNTGGISITGTHVAGGFGINLNNKNEVISTGGGPITLTADDLRIVGDSTLASSGDLTVRPETPGTTIGLGGGSGTLELDDSELAYFSGFGAITIGDAAAGDITIDTATFADPLNLLTGGAVFDGPGADLTMTNGDVVTINGVVSPGLSPGQLVVDGDFAFGGGSTFDLELEGTTPGSQHDQIRVEGAARNVDLNNATLSTSLGAGYTPAFGEELVIVDLVDAGSTLSGAFSGLAEGDLVNIGGADFSISYAGGADNNDVVLTVFADTEVSLSGGVLSITDIFGGSSNDNLTISHSAGSYTISDSGGLLIGSEIPGASGSLTSTLVVPDTGVTSIVFDTLGGDDVLTVNSVQASLPGGFTVNDGAGSDRFTLGGDIDAAAGDVSITVSRNILLAAGSSISTSSGDITLEANLANASSGDFTGIEINDAELTTASGAITLSGQGGDTGSGGRRNGVYVLNGATVSSTGSGAVGPITISGTGAGGAGVISGAFGVDIASDFPSLTAPAMVTSVDADIVITGSGANAPAGGAGATPGVVVRDGGTLESTGSGSITLDGTGGTTASGGSVGVSLANVNLFTSTTSRVRTNTGGISITGTHVAGGFGINLNNKNEVISTGGGPITLTADDLRIVGDSTLASSGDLTVRPETPGTTIGLGGGSGTLELDDSELAYFSGFGAITIGDAAAGDITIDTATFADPLNLLTGGAVFDGPGADLTMTNGDVVTINGVVSPGLSPGQLVVDGDFAFGGGSTFDLELEGTTPGSQHDQIRVEGAARNVDLNNATLSTSLGAGYTPAFGEELVIVDNVGAGSTVSGTFAGLAEGATFMVSGTPLQIFYSGGTDNNDVVLLVNSPPTIISPASVDVVENETFVIDVQSTDPDGETENGGGLTYSKTGGADQAQFALDPNTGVLTFIVPPDFENPTDAGADNVYDVQVTVNDGGGLTDVQDIAVTVTDVDAVNELADGISDVQDEIDQLLNDPGVTDEAKKKLQKANDKLNDALDELAEGDVKKGIKKVSDAVKELVKAADEGADVANLIDLLVDLSRTVAQEAIDTAILVGGDPDDIAKAQEEMVKGQEDLDDNPPKPEKALDHFAKAWEHAQDALPSGLHAGRSSKGPDAAKFVSPQDVHGVLDAAIAYWRQQGAAVHDLHSVNVHVLQLPGSYLGLANADSIWIDADAAGYGWSPEATGGGMHLLSAVTHELGHLLGFDHDHTAEVMHATLLAGQSLFGERRAFGLSRADGDALITALAPALTGSSWADPHQHSFFVPHVLTDEPSSWIGERLLGIDSTILDLANGRKPSVSNLLEDDREWTWGLKSDEDREESLDRFFAGFGTADDPLSQPSLK